MIYAVEILDLKYVKIGYSGDEDLSKRIAKLQTGCPFEIRPVIQTYGTIYQERAIHSSLKIAFGRIRIPNPPNEWYQGRHPFFKKFLEYLKYGPDAALALSEQYNPAIKQPGKRPGKRDSSPIFIWGEI